MPIAKDGEYAVSYGRRNCFAHFTQTFLKGQEAPKKFVCPTCGTYNAEKGWSRPIALPIKPQVDREWPYIPYPPRPRPYDPPWKKPRKNPFDWPRVPRRTEPYCRENTRIGGGEGQRDFLC